MSLPLDQTTERGGDPGERLSQRAYQAIRVSLRNGELQPGQRLILRPLASKLGLSATPVREALLRLVSEQALGLDERHSVLVPMLGGEDLDELEELRTDLEGRAAAVAATRASATDIDALAVLQDELELARTHDDRDAIFDLDTEFHRCLVVLSGRPTLLRVVDGIGARLGPILALTREAKMDVVGLHPHRHILDAMRARDADGARAWMIKDVAASFRRVRSGLEGLTKSIEPAALAASVGLAHSDV